MTLGHRIYGTTKQYRHQRVELGEVIGDLSDGSVKATGGSEFQSLADWMAVVASAMVYPAPTAGYYHTWGGTTAASAAYAAADVIYMYPVYIPSPRTIKTLVMRVTTGGAGSSIKMAIWANSPVSNRPLGAPLVVDNTGIASETSSTTIESNVADVLLPAGWYWFGSKSKATLPAMWSIASTGQLGFTFMPAATASVIFSTGLSFADAFANDMPTFAEGASFTLTAATIPIIDYSI